MSKWYEVKVTAITVFAVEVKDDEDDEAAMEYATNGISGGDVTMEALLVDGDEHIDRLKRHADEVLQDA